MGWLGLGMEYPCICEIRKGWDRTWRGLLGGWCEGCELMEMGCASD